MSWNRNEIIQLIEEFKQQEVLWNHVALDHGTQQARLDSWNYIASVLNRPVDEVRRKVSSVLASYRRTRILELKTTEHPFKPTWEYYKYLSFMHELRRPKPYRRKPNTAKNHHDESYIIDDDDLQIIDDTEDQSYEASLIGDNSQMNFHNYNDSDETGVYASQVINLADDLEPLPKREKSFSSSYNHQTEDESTIGINSRYDKVPRYQVTSSYESSSNHDNHVSQISSSVGQGRSSSKNTQNSILPIAISQKNTHSRESTAQHHTTQLITAFDEQSNSILPNSVDADSLQSNEPSTTQLVPAAVKDECSTYGDYVACKLRCYPEKTKNLVQHYINNIIFEADMGKLC